MSHNAKHSGADCPLEQVLGLATKTAKTELGTTASNKKVSATATLATSVTENGSTNNEGVNATVSLGVSSSTSEAAPDCCCAGQACQSSCCCKKDAAKKS